MPLFPLNMSLIFLFRNNISKRQIPLLNLSPHVPHLLLLNIETIPRVCLIAHIEKLLRAHITEQFFLSVDSDEIRTAG